LENNYPSTIEDLSDSIPSDLSETLSLEKDVLSCENHHDATNSGTNNSSNVHIPIL
jgi:hypothetical protein